MLKGVNVYVNVTWLFDGMKLNLLKEMNVCECYMIV
jgi:hypothetical protein